MRLNWFSPLPPSPTGIAEYAALVLPELSRHAEVCAWTSQDRWDRALERHVQIRRIEGYAEFWRDVHRADMSLYHLGNHAGFHADIWGLSRSHPGVVVLHDLRLPHLFAGIYVEYRRDRSAYRQLMLRFYGQRGLLAADEVLSQEREVSDLAVEFPFTEFAVEGALGVLVHSREGLSLLRRRGESPLVVAELPYRPRSHAGLRGVEDPTKLIVFGHLGPNRRLDSLFEALAGLEERSRYRIDVFGALWNEAELRRLLTKLGISELVRLRGFVEDEELETGLGEADLAVNLRYPTMGEASLSQLRIWEHALPSLVTPSGWFGQLPEDCVVFIPAESREREVQMIRRALLRLRTDAEAFRRMGQRGRERLETKHGVDTYVERLLGLAGSALRQRLRWSQRRAARSVGREVGSWRGATLRREVAERAFERLLELKQDPSSEGDVGS